MTKFKFIKNRVNTNTKAGKASEGVAGFTVTEIISALKGDQKILNKFYECHKEGTMAKTLMPAIVETIGTKIQNEKDWNEFLGQFVKDGSQTETSIQKSMNSASMANAKFVNGMEEVSEAFKAEWEMERGRHKWAINYNRAQFVANAIVQDIEGKVRVLEQGSKLQQKQLQENDAYELKAAETVLKYGEQGLKTIHERDYVGAVKKPSRIFARVKNAFGI